MHFINVADLVDSGWTFIERHCGNPAITWEFHVGKPESRIERAIRKPDLARWRAAFKAARGAARNDRSVLVSHLPRMGAVTNLFRRKFCPGIPQIAFAFNFTDLPVGLDYRRLRAWFAGIDEFVVFSDHERSLYPGYFDIEPDRFVHLPWAMERPQPGPINPVDGIGRYICSVGGEGRDYALLAKAMTTVPEISMVVVARPHSVRGIDFPPNVKVFTNLPAPETWRIVYDSSGVVIPLKDDRTNCGHITIVGSLLLGRVIIITETRSIRDYVRDGENALLVPAGDVEAMIQALRRVERDPDGMMRLGARAALEASKRHSLDVWVDYFEKKNAHYERLRHAG